MQLWSRKSRIHDQTCMITGRDHGGLREGLRRVEGGGLADGLAVLGGCRTVWTVARRSRVVEGPASSGMIMGRAFTRRPPRSSSGIIMGRASPDAHQGHRVGRTRGIGPFGYTMIMERVPHDGHQGHRVRRTRGNRSFRYTMIMKRARATAAKVGAGTPRRRPRSSCQAHAGERSAQLHDDHGGGTPPAAGLIRSTLSQPPELRSRWRQGPHRCGCRVR
jgi:hypothetical protein